MAGIFLGLGSFFALAWAQKIRLVYIGNATAEYREGPTIFWLIKLLDFGFMIPLLLATGAGLMRRNRTAIKVAYGLATFATCLAGCITGMAAVMQAKGDPSAQPLMLVVLVPATIGVAVVTEHLLRSYVQGTRERPELPATPRVGWQMG